MGTSTMTVQEIGSLHREDAALDQPRAPRSSILGRVVARCSSRARPIEWRWRCALRLHPPRDRYRVRCCPAEVREANEALREGGRHLIRLGDVVDCSTSFAERCELLGVNPADRQELPVDAGFAAIIGLGFEASSQFRIDGGERVPCFRQCGR